MHEVKFYSPPLTGGCVLLVLVNVVVTIIIIVVLQLFYCEMSIF